MTGLTLLMACCLLGAPDYTSLSQSPWKVTPLPGQSDVVFTMYSCPADEPSLRELVGVMKEKGLGNGFDPGPPAGAPSLPLFQYLATVGWPMILYPNSGDFQVKDGNTRLTDADEAALKPLDDAKIFTGIQLGEWGYYFHNLSMNADYWKGLYGANFDQMKSKMKPAGLFGYDSKPADKKACYDILRDYFTTRNTAMRGRNISVTGHSHYEAYAGEWGAKVIGLELGENIAYTQSKIAFARGAARRWQKPWSLQMSPWMGPSCTTAGPLRNENGIMRGLDAGHSLSLFSRMWLHGWFAGAAMITPENSLAIFFEEAKAPWKLTPHGEKAREIFAFMRSHDRGIPYTPVAVVLDHLAGFNAYQNKPWGILEPTVGDQEAMDLFNRQLFPGSDHWHQPRSKENPEESYLRPTPYGELCDVLLSNAGGNKLGAYRAVVLVGDITFDEACVATLCGALEHGSTLLLQPRHIEAMGSEWDYVQSKGQIEELDEWTNPDTGRSAAISNERLAQLSRAWLPVRVEGDPVQYQVNRNQRGWVVELVNNRGVVKKGDSPAVVDPAATATVRIVPDFTPTAATEWRSGKTLPTTSPITVTIAAGETAFVALEVN